MAFLKKSLFKYRNRNHKLNQKKSSLQAYSDSYQKTLQCNFLMKQWTKSKRSSLFSSNMIKASMTVEASFVVPVVIFFLMNLLSAILIFKDYGEQLAILHQRGKEFSTYAYSSTQMIPLKEEMIELVHLQSAEPLFPMIAFKSTKLLNYCTMRAWTGYDVEKLQDTEEKVSMVYITETGTVYHKSRGCTYLNLTIQFISYLQLSSRRNEYGEKYEKCEICGSSGSGQLVYVTNQGNRFHSKLSCSGLKRTIECVPITEVGGRAACSRCSQ